jgi:hypothetical protein
VWLNYCHAKIPALPVVWAYARNQMLERRIRGFQDTPLSSSESPDSASILLPLARNSPQNREPEGVRGHNRENKGVTRFAFIARPAASGLTIFCAFFAGHKVRCHRVGLWKKIRVGCVT